MSSVTNDYDSDFDGMDCILQGGKTDSEAPAVLPINEKECTARESNVAMIKVVVCCKTLRMLFVKLVCLQIFPLGRYLFDVILESVG